MPSSIFTLVLAGTLALGPTVGTGSTAPNAAGEAVKVRLDVDASSLGADQAVGEAIASAVATKLAEEGIAVDAEQALEVSIRVRRFSPKAVADFFVDVQLMRDGELVESLETSGCAKCIDEFLVAHVVERVPEIEERVRALQEDAPQQGGSSSSSDAATAAGAASSEAEPRPEPGESSGRKLEVGLIAGGAAGCAVGLGTLIGGVLVWADGTSVARSGSQPQQIEIADRRVVGYGLIGAGTVLIAAGSALIVVGSLRRNDSRKARPSLAPVMGQGAWGVSFSGRF